MKRLFLSLCLTVAAVTAFSQDWEKIRNSTSTYLTGEGWGSTVYEADQQALADLISKISVMVSSNFEVLEGEEHTNDSISYSHYIQNKVSTFSNATLTNTGSVILQNEPDAHVGRWIKKSEIDKIFESRKAKVLEYVTNARSSESKGKLDDALRNYYWAYTMLKTLQHPSEMKFTDEDGYAHTLVSWIPEMMDNIFDDIDPLVVGKDGNDLQLQFTFRGKPVASLDYTYFDGSHWSNIYSAKDGKGVLELAPGAMGNSIQLKYEYAYLNEAHIDKELYGVISVVKGNAMKSSYATLSPKAKKSAAKAALKVETQESRQTARMLTQTDEEADVKAVMNKLVKAIGKKDYAAVEKYFTADGLEMYRKLISYGNASLVGTPVYNMYMSGDRTVVRSVPMSFSFNRGVRKSFVENVVFTFDGNGKIDCLAFALDEAAVQDILRKQAWPENARTAIIEFLENYKTAFALKRLDYIRTIFDDNAVIIVGKVAKISKPAMNDNSANFTTDNTVVTRTRYTKSQYLKQLERCFASNEFVNIRFADNDVVKAGKGGEVYGIQIRQDYYSTNYGDSGYLFLLVDINKPMEPTIKIRTWQPEPDPIDGLFDLSDF